jgi:hypothetical protein
MRPYSINCCGVLFLIGWVKTMRQTNGEFVLASVYTVCVCVWEGGVVVGNKLSPCTSMIHILILILMQ